MPISTRRTAVCCCLAVLLAAPAGAQRKAPPKECELKQYTSIDLIDAGNLLVPVTLEGKPGAMVLNTASALTVVWTEAEAELGLKSRRLPISADVTYSGERVTHYASLKSFVIGSLNFGQAEFMLVPRRPGLAKSSPLPVFGAIGMDVFQHVDFELDLSRRKLNLFSQDHCPGNVVYWSDAYAEAPLYRGKIGEFFFPIELEGKKVQATIAPDRPTTTLNVDLTRRLYGFDADSPGVVKEEEGTDPENPIAHYRAMKLTAPGLTVTDIKIRLLPERKDCRLTTFSRPGAGYDETCMGAYPMHLGSNILTKLRLYFATKEKKVYFTAADAGRTAPAP